MSASVEIEFAVNYSVPRDAPKEFRILQMRPMVLDQEYEELKGFPAPGIHARLGVRVGF